MSSRYGRKPARGTTIRQGRVLGGRGNPALLPLRVRAVLGGGRIIPGQTVVGENPRRTKRAATHAARRVHQKKYWYRRLKRRLGL